MGRRSFPVSHTVVVGDSVGLVEGLVVGDKEGETLGLVEGSAVGISVGADVSGLQ
jgi:hypothetical protein